MQCSTYISLSYIQLTSAIHLCTLGIQFKPGTTKNEQKQSFYQTNRIKLRLQSLKLVSTWLEAVCGGRSVAIGPNSRCNSTEKAFPSLRTQHSETQSPTLLFKSTGSSIVVQVLISTGHRPLPNYMHSFFCWLDQGSLVETTNPAELDAGEAVSSMSSVDGHGHDEHCERQAWPGLSQP